MNTIEPDISIDSFLDAFRSSTRERRLRALKLLHGEEETKSHSPEPYLTGKELAALLKVNLSTIWRWRLPKHQIMGRTRYLHSEVETYIQEKAAQFKKNTPGRDS